jgi:hypothetical protein
VERRRTPVSATMRSTLRVRAAVFIWSAALIVLIVLPNPTEFSIEELCIKRLHSLGLGAACATDFHRLTELVLRRIFQKGLKNFVIEQEINEKTKRVWKDLTGVSSTSATSVSAGAAVAATEKKTLGKRMMMLAAGALLLTLLGAGSWMLGARSRSVPPPTYHQLTFERGLVWRSTTFRRLRRFEKRTSEFDWKVFCTDCSKPPKIPFAARFASTGIHEVAGSAPRLPVFLPKKEPKSRQEKVRSDRK